MEESVNIPKDVYLFSLCSNTTTKLVICIFYYRLLASSGTWLQIAWNSVRLLFLEHCFKVFGLVLNNTLWKFPSYLTKDVILFGYHMRQSFWYAIHDVIRWITFLPINPNFTWQINRYSFFPRKFSSTADTSFLPFEMVQLYIHR